MIMYLGVFTKLIFELCFKTDFFYDTNVSYYPAQILCIPHVFYTNFRLRKRIPPPALCSTLTILFVCHWSILSQYTLYSGHNRYWSNPSQKACLWSLLLCMGQMIYDITLTSKLVWSKMCHRLVRCFYSHKQQLQQAANLEWDYGVEAGMCVYEPKMSFPCLFNPQGAYATQSCMALQWRSRVLFFLNLLLCHNPNLHCPGIHILSS